MPEVHGYSERVLVTKRRDSSGWRRIRVGRGKQQVSLILDDRAGAVCTIRPWVETADIDKLIIGLQVGADECRKAKR